MTETARHELMTVQEVAEYLRIKERKVYDLLAQKRIPCVRVTGKWLFPRPQIDLWLSQNSASSASGTAMAVAPPPLLVGSHDPLLEWALREIDSPLGQQITGSTEGLLRLASGEAVLCGTHVPDPATGEFNLPLIHEKLGDADVVAIEWAGRQQGIVLAKGNPLGLTGLPDLISCKARFAGRQPGSGGRQMLSWLCEKAALNVDQINQLAPAVRSETEVGLAVAAGKANAGLAIAAVARQLNLDFLPLACERFDLVLRRRDYFEPPFQALLAFARTETFRNQAAELGGYDIAALGAVRYNGP